MVAEVHAIRSGSVGKPRGRGCRACGCSGWRACGCTGRRGMQLTHKQIYKQFIRWWWRECVWTHVNKVMECVAVCCSVLQCVAVCCSVLQCVAVCCAWSHVNKVMECVKWCQTWNDMDCAKACQMMQCVTSCHSDGVCHMMWVAECMTGSCHTWVVPRHVKWCRVSRHVTVGVCQVMCVVECITPWALACITSLRASSSREVYDCLKPSSVLLPLVRESSSV